MAFPEPKPEGCPEAMCMMYCENGFEKGPDGCDICKCRKACSPVMCQKYCPKGFKKDKNGCEICSCSTSILKDKKDPIVKKEPKSEDICNQPKLVGLCRARKRAWYYDSKTKQCTMFFYGGCGGNKNNFNSEAACQKMCQKDVISKADACPDGMQMVKCYVDPCQYSKCPAYPDAKCSANYCGGCKAEFFTWDKAGKRNVTGMCKPSVTPGYPMDKYLPKECEQPKKPGLCKAAITRWFYNGEGNECQPFTYGGCGANDNNFMSKDHCEERCVHGTAGTPTTAGPYPVYYQKPHYKKKRDKFESVKKLAALAEKHDILPADGPRNMTKDYHPDYPENMKVCLCY